MPAPSHILRLRSNQYHVRSNLPNQRLAHPAIHWILNKGPRCLQRLEAASDGARAGHLPDRPWIAKAFESAPLENARFEDFAEEAAGGAGDEDGVRLGMRLKPRRKIWGTTKLY